MINWIENEWRYHRPSDAALGLLVLMTTVVWPILVFSNENASLAVVIPVTVIAWIVGWMVGKQRFIENRLRDADIEASMRRHPVTPKPRVRPSDFSTEMALLRAEHYAALQVHDPSESRRIGGWLV